MPSTNRHYVYMLVDPQSGIPFYVGKGQRRRAWVHAELVRQGDLSGNAAKVAAIQEIFARGEEVEIQIVAEYEDEDDALQHEFELVERLPCLTNILPGGGRLRRLSKEEVRKRLEECGMSYLTYPTLQVNDGKG